MLWGLGIAANIKRYTTHRKSRNPLDPRSETTPLNPKPTQRAQYPLIEEYSLNHNMKPYIIKPYSLIKGSWALWVPEDCHPELQTLSPTTPQIGESLT